MRAPIAVIAISSAVRRPLRALARKLPHTHGCANAPIRRPVIRSIRTSGRSISLPKHRGFSRRRSAFPRCSRTTTQC